MTNKLQQARRAKLLKQEMTADETTIIRQQLRDGITPENWNDGFFATTHDGILPPVHFPVMDWSYAPDRTRSFSQVVVEFYDYAWIGKKHIDFNYRRQDVPDEQQCKEDAERITP